jgi:hypothetical protein
MERGFYQRRVGEKARAIYSRQLPSVRMEAPVTEPHSSIKDDRVLPKHRVVRVQPSLVPGSRDARRRCEPTVCASRRRHSVKESLRQCSACILHRLRRRNRHGRPRRRVSVFIPLRPQERFRQRALRQRRRGTRHRRGRRQLCIEGRIGIVCAHILQTRPVQPGCLRPKAETHSRSDRLYIVLNSASDGTQR